MLIRAVVSSPELLAPLERLTEKFLICRPWLVGCISEIQWHVGVRPLECGSCTPSATFQDGIVMLDKKPLAYPLLIRSWELMQPWPNLVVWSMCHQILFCLLNGARIRKNPISLARGRTLDWIRDGSNWGRGPDKFDGYNYITKLQYLGK